LCTSNKMATTSPFPSKHRRLFLDTSTANATYFPVQVRQANLRPALLCGFNVKLVPESHLECGELRAASAALIESSGGSGCESEKIKDLDVLLSV
jgi:hypothetical protein